MSKLDLAAAVNRRLGRVEMLLTELAQLPDGYDPTARERAMFAALATRIEEVFCPPPTPIESAPAAPMEAEPKRKGK